MTVEELGRKKILLYLSGEITVTSHHRHNTYRCHIGNISSKDRQGYHISRSTRRKLTSSAFLLKLKSKHNVIFPTLTFPTEPDGNVNKYLNRFLSNFRKTYGLRDYLWVRENTKSGRAHFHILADFPYTPIRKINKAWCMAIGQESKNAVRLPPGHKSVVRDITGICRYLTKYFTKEGGKYYPERCYGISKDINAESIRLSLADYLQIKKDFSGKTFENEWCRVDNIYDFFNKWEYFVPYVQQKNEYNE